MKKDGKDVIVPFSLYNDNALQTLIRSPGDYSFSYNLKSFGDTTGHWAEKEITFVTAREIFQGVEDGKFAPGGTMTRAMFVTALARLDGADVTGYTGSRFGDVAGGQWYTGAVEWAAEHGIVSGVSSSQFAPDASVTREQMTLMLHNFMKVKGYVLKDKAEAGVFTDSGSISTWAAESVGILQRAGIIDGKQGNAFDPRGLSTRAEVSSILARFISGLVQ
ncbi:Endo-1,4-beta-xylanase A precursor [compost metagenome]